MKALNELSENIFIDHSDEYNHAFDVWQRLCSNSSLLNRVLQSKLPWQLPQPLDFLGTTVAIPRYEKAYSILGVDGSQIYPDRHQGTNCYLINIGSVFIPYHQTNKKVILDSEPYLFTGGENDPISNSPVSIDTINCLRELYELCKGVTTSLDYMPQHTAEAHHLYLIDGSLVFWHLDAKELSLRTHFLKHYCLELEKLFEAQIPFAGYISAPKNKELVYLLRGLMILEESPTTFEHSNDATLVSYFLKPSMRTAFFRSNAQITQEYPAALVPYFTYINTGTEIARIELPRWIIQKSDLCDIILAIIIDQTQKGYGYPVALSEAHEQAVVKGPDRDFFYHAITRLGIKKSYSITPSRKAIKKKINYL